MSARDTLIMGAPLEPVIIAEQGGLVVAEHGAAVLLIDRGNRVVEITAYVLIVLTLVFGGFGAVSIVDSVTDGRSSVPITLGTILLAVGVSAAVVAGFMIRSAYRIRRRALSTFTPLAVFDRAQRVYRDGADQAVAPLDQVRFERRMQMTSSSPQLVAVTPWGTHILKRGNPFGGGIGRVDEVLNDMVQGRTL
ncbi:hypothetical protein [Mycolicibacterium pyrenivorans]|uniref:hypothetical protein n=1 Tax=Mycolicibacterium pyrenivorans TaxID=187102 RepID=UPI0021F3771E|nr:hypothetical protein [Mycolicibacterium pyrenivorans]